jgi:hypothetical protein
MWETQMTGYELRDVGAGLKPALTKPETRNIWQTKDDMKKYYYF